jgi:hypothetical protein
MRNNQVWCFPTPPKQQRKQVKAKGIKKGPNKEYHRIAMAGFVIWIDCQLVYLDSFINLLDLKQSHSE